MDLERYAIVVSAAVEADEVVLDLDKGVLDELEAKLNQELSGTESIGEQAGKELAQGIEQGAVEGLDVRQVLAKLRSVLKGEVKELATEEVKALRAAIQHALGVQLDDNVRRQLSESAKLLDRVIDTATRNQSLTVRLRFDADRSALLTAQRIAEGYIEDLKKQVNQDKSSPVFRTLKAIYGADSGLYNEVRDKFFALIKQDLQEAIVRQIKHGSGEIKLPDTQALLNIAGLPTLKQALLLSGTAQSGVIGNIASELQKYVPDVLPALQALKKASWEVQNKVVRQAKEAMYEAQSARRAALGITDVSNEEGRVPFAKRTRRFDVAEMLDEGEPDEFQDLLRVQASSKGKVDETLLAQMVVKRRAARAVLRKLLDTANNPEEQAIWRRAIKTLYLANQTYNLERDEDFQKLMTSLKTEEDIAKLLPRLRDVTFSDQVTLSDKYVFVPRDNRPIYLSHLRRENIYRTPVNQVMTLPLSEGAVRIKELEEKALGDGALGIFRPKTLGLPDDYAGVVQVRGELTGKEGEVLAGLKGTVIVDPRAKEDFINLNDLYRGDAVVGGKKYSKEEVDAMIKERFAKGELALNLGVHRVGTVEESKIGKQVFIRHMGGVPFSRGSITPSEAAKWAAQAKELKFLPLIANRELGLTHYQQIATLAKSLGVEVNEGQYAMAAAHTAYKDLDPEVYKILEEGIELDAEGRPIVPIVVGKEMAAKLGLREGDISHIFRNPVMGHKGSVLKARIAAIRDNLKAVIVNQEHAKSTGVDFDGDTLVVLPKGLPIQAAPLEVFQTLMAGAGLAGGRKGGGPVEPSEGELRFKEQLEIYDRVLERLRKSQLAVQLKNAGIEDLENPFEVIRQLEAFGEEELLKDFKRYLRRGFGKELGIKDKDELNRYLFEGFLDYRKKFLDPRRVYKKLPFYPSAALAASVMGLEAVKAEYNPEDPTALAAGQLTTSFLGLSETLAQAAELNVDFKAFEQAVRDLNQARASGDQARIAQATKALEEQLKQPAMQKLLLSNMAYQIITDRKKRDYALHIRTSSGETLEFRNFYAVLQGLIAGQDLSELADVVYDPSGQVVEDRRPARALRTKELVKGLIDRTKRQSYKGIQVTAVKGLQELEGQVAGVKYDKAFVEENLKEAPVAPVSLSDITTLIYRGIATKEGLAETNLSAEEVAKRAANTMGTLAKLRRALDAGEVEGYRHDSEKRKAAIEDYKELVLSQEALLRQSYAELVAGTLRTKILEKGFRSELLKQLRGTGVTDANLDQYIEEVIKNVKEYAEIDLFHGIWDDPKKQKELVEDGLLKVFSSDKFRIPREKAKELVAFLEGKSQGKDAEKYKLIDRSLALRSGYLPAAIVPVKRMATYLDLVQSASAPVPKLDDPELESLLKQLKDVESYSFWSQMNLYGAQVDRLAERLSEGSEKAAIASRYVAEAFRSADIAYRVLPQEHLGALLKRQVFTAKGRGAEIKKLLGKDGVTLGEAFRRMYAPLWQSFVSILPSLGFVKRDGKVTNLGYEPVGHAVLMPESLVKGTTTAYADVLAKYDEAIAKVVRKGVTLERLATGYLDDKGRFVESDERKELAKYRFTVQGMNLGKRTQSVSALLGLALGKVLPLSKGLSTSHVQKIAQFNLELANSLTQAIQEAIDEPSELGTAKAVEAMEEMVNTAYEAVKDQVSPETKKALEEAKARVAQALKLEAPKEEEASNIKALAKELAEASKAKRERIKDAVARLRAGTAKLARIEERKGRPDFITGKEPLDDRTLEAQAEQAARYVNEAIERQQYDAAEQVLESMEKNPRVRKRVIRTVRRTVRQVASTTGGGDGGKPPSEPPSPPPPPADDEGDDRRKRRIKYWPSILLGNKVNLLVNKETGELKESFWDIYKGVVRSQAEEDLFRAIFLNSERGQSSKLGFKEFVLNYPELANTFFGPLRSFAGRETFINEKHLLLLAQHLDAMLSAYEKGDVEALGALTEDLNVMAKRIENADKILADLREFKKTGALPHGRNLHTASRDALFYRRLMSIGGKELERAVEAGDIDTVLKVADRARHVEERIKLMQNAISNSLAFMFSSVVLGLFGTIQQEFLKMDRQAKAVAALANMTGKESIGKGISRVADALNVAQEELVQALASLSREGVDPEAAKSIFAKLNGLLNATGESIGELVQLYKELDRLGADTKDRTIKNLVKERVYLGEAAEVISKLGLKPGEVKASDLDELILAASRYYRAGVPVVLPEKGQERQKRLRELIKEGADIARSTPDAKTSLEPTDLEKLLRQAERTMKAVIEAAKPALAIIGSFLMALLKVLEGVAYVLSTPLGKVAVVAGTIYATLLAIMQLQKTFQVGEWVRALLAGLKELNGELLVFMKNIVRAFTDGTFSDWFKNGPFGSLVQTLLGGLEAVIRSPKMKEFGAVLERAIRGAFERVKGAVGGALDFLFNFPYGRQIPIGLVDPSTVAFQKLLSKGGWKGALLGSLPVLGALGAGAYQMVRAEDMSPFQHLLGTLGNVLMLASMFLPGGVVVRGLTLPLRALAGVVGASLGFGVPFVAGRSVQARERSVADAEFTRALKTAGGPEALARALTGELTPALEKAGYTAENLGQILDAAMNKGSASVKNTAREVKAMADSLIGLKRVMDSVGERAKTYTSEYDAYFRFAGSNAFTALNNDQLEVFKRVFGTELIREPAYRVFTKGLNFRLQSKIMDLFEMNFLEGPLAGVLDAFGVDRNKLTQEVVKVRELSRQFSMADKGYFPELFASASRGIYSDKGLEYNLKNALLIETIGRLRGDTFRETLANSQRASGLAGTALGLGVGTAIAPGVGSLLGALLGFLLGQAVSPYVARLAQTYGNINVVRPSGLAKPALRAALTLAGVTSQIESDLVETLRGEGVKKADAILTTGLSAFKGKDRVKTRQALETAVKDLNEYVNAINESLVKQYTLKYLGFDYKADLEGDRAFISLGNIYTRRVRSQLPELEAQREALRDKLGVLQAGYSKYLEFDAKDGNVEVRIREGFENNAVARAAFASAVEEVKSLGVNLAKLNDQIKQTRFVELLEQIAIKADQAFMRRIGELGYGAALVAGKIAVPDSPFNAFINRIVQNDLRDNGLFGDTPGLKPVITSGQVSYSHKAERVAFDPTKVFGGTVTQVPGQRGWLNPLGHAGYDIALRPGTPIKWGSVEGRVVRIVSAKDPRNAGYGNLVVIQDPQGNLHYFGHLKEMPTHLKVGDRVGPGQIIGHSGSTGRSTGPHLHYEIRDAKNRVIRSKEQFDAIAGSVYGASAATQTRGATVSIKPMTISAPVSVPMPLDEKTLKESEEAWKTVLAKYYAMKSPRVGEPVPLEDLQKELNRAIASAQKDPAIRQVAKKVLAYIDPQALMGTNATANINKFIEKVITLYAEGVDLNKALILAQSEILAARIDTEKESSILGLQQKLYAPDKNITTFEFQRRQAQTEYKAAIISAKAEMEKQLAKLEADYKAQTNPSRAKYEADKKRILDSYALEVTRANEELNKKLAEISYNETVYRVEQETAFIRNERERITRQLEALKAFREKYGNKLTANINAELNRRIEELERQLQLLGPDLSKLREAEVRANLTQMLTGLNRPNLALNVQKLAESIYNDKELTTEQKRKLGVNPEAKGLKDLLLAGGLMDNFLKVAEIADKYFDTTVPKLQAYKSKLSYAALQGTAYLLESPVKLAETLQKKAEYMAAELRKNPAVQKTAKQIGVSVEELVGYIVENTVGGAVREAQAIARQAKQNALQLQMLGAMASPFFSDVSVDFQRRALAMEAEVEDLQRSVIDLPTEEKQELIANAKKRLAEAKEVAPILDALATQYNKLQFASFKNNLQGGKIINALLGFASSVYAQMGEERKDEATRFLMSLGINPTVLQQQLEDLVLQRHIELTDFKLKLEQRQQQIALFQKYGLATSVEAEIARAKLQAEYEKDLALLQNKQQRAKALREVDTYSDAELYAAAEALGVNTLGITDANTLKERVKEALTKRFNDMDAAIQEGAKQAVEEATFRILRGNLQSSSFANRVEAATRLLADGRYLDALSPEELKLANQLKGLDGKKLDEALKRIAAGEPLTNKLTAAEVNALESLGVNIVDLLALPEDKRLMESPYTTDRLTALETLIERLREKTEGSSAVLTRLQREAASLRSQQALADLQAKLEDLNNSDVLQFGVGGTKAALDVIKQQIAIVKVEALKQRVNLEQAAKMTPTELEKLAKDLGVSVDVVTSWVELYKSVTAKAKQLERQVEIRERFRIADQLLFKASRLDTEYAYSDIATKRQAQESLLVSLQEELFKQVGGKIDPASLLGLDADSLAEMLDVAPDVAQRVLELVNAIDALGRQVKESRIAESLAKLAADIARVERSLQNAYRIGSFAEVMKAQERAYAEYSRIVADGLRTLELAEEDLYLTEEEIKAKLQVKGLEGRLGEVEALRRANEAKRAAAIEAASLELLTAKDEKEAEEILRRYGIDYEALKSAAPGTEAYRLREQLLKNPIFNNITRLGAVRYQQELISLIAEGDVEAIEERFAKAISGLDDSKYGKLKQMYRKGMDPASFTELAKMSGLDNQTVSLLELLSVAQSNALTRKLQLVSNDISMRYDAIAPLFNGPFSAARLEILKLQEMYAKYKAIAEEAAQEGKTKEAEEAQKKAEELFQSIVDAQKRYRLIIVREWSAMLADMENALKGALKESVSAIIGELLFNRSKKELDKIDRRYQDELQFTETDLEEARKQKEALEKKLRQGGLSNDEYLRTKELYEYYTRKVEELEDKVKRVKFEWEQARREVESLAEVLDRIIQKLADALLNKFIDWVVDMLWEGIKAGFEVSASGGGQSAPVATQSATLSPQSVGAATPAASSTASTVQTLSAGANALSAQGAKVSPQSAKGFKLPMEASIGLNAFATGLKMGEDDNILLGVGGVMGGTALQAGIGAILAGGSLEAGIAAAAGVLANPIAWGIAALGVGIGAAIASNLRADEFNRKHAGTGAYGWYNPADLVRKGARLQVQVNVDSNLDPDEVAEEAKKAIAKEMRTAEYKGGLETL
jgi:murein DD-endopeptidase MepM/ murein hydrolase activator NlpD